VKHTTKKAIALMLMLSMIFCVGTPAVAVNDSYPESEHNYQNNIEQKWHYDYGENVKGIYVTFSDKTSVEKPTEEYHEFPKLPNGLVIGGGYMKEIKSGDKIIVTADDYSYTATGKALAGKTLYIPDISFDICLKTDSSVTDYGFSIDRISHTAPDDVAIITYDCCDSCDNEKILCYNQGEEIKVEKGNYCNSNDLAFVSWLDDDGNEYYADESLEFKSRNLKAKKISLLLGSDEIWSFCNSDPYFDPDYNGGYYLTTKDFLTMQKNIYKVFGIGVLPAIGLSIALATYPDWYWNGSCYGMSATTFLQHYGQIDILKNRSEKSLSELTNEDDILSLINYYQWALSGSFLCENFSLDKGSKMYSKQLEDMFESVSNGNIVLFTYYSGETIKTSGHAVLLTGAYTQKDGTKVLVAYDCNWPEDYIANTFEQRFYIDPDFTTIKRGYDYPAAYLNEYGEFNWTDDYSQFEAFNREETGGVFSWYSLFFSQLGKLIKNLVSL
jgi:hypothetical protein